MRRGLSLLALVLLPALSSAQTCLMLGHAAAGATQSVDASVVAGAISGVIGSNYTFTRCEPNTYEGTGSLPLCYWDIVGPPPTPDGFQVLLDVVDYDPTECPAPPECESDIGEGQWQVSPTSISGEKWCQDGCEVSAGASSCGGPPGLQTCTTWAAISALSCTGPDESPGGGDDPPSDPPEGAEPEGDVGAPGEAGENCVSIGDGEYCGSPNNGGDCGYINDTYTCLSKVKEDECKILGDGGRVCGDQASSTPPVPDSGTPGEIASADGQLSQSSGGTTNNFNYYSPGTVAGSSRDPGTTGASGAASSGSPHAPIPGENDGDGDGDGEGGECVGADCSAEVPTLAEIGTLSDAMGQFWSDLQAVPVIDAASSIAPSFGAGACPDWSTTVPLYSADIDIDFTSACGLWTDISPVLGAVCLVMFGLLAFRILFSA